jgi:hypothetical protein
MQRFRSFDLLISYSGFSQKKLLLNSFVLGEWFVFQYFTHENKYQYEMFFRLDLLHCNIDKFTCHMNAILNNIYYIYKDDKKNTCYTHRKL